MEKVPFDPGIAQFAPCFSQEVEYYMSQVLATKAVHQRKFKFQIVQPQIFASFEKIVGFYSGCLLWAYFIKNSEKGAEKEITGNNFFGRDVLNSEDFDFLYEIDFLINYFEKYQKDVKFFLGKTVQLDENWLIIAKTYREFLELNNNFVQTKTTNDLKIPEQFKVGMPIGEIKVLFDRVINSGKLQEFAQKIFE